MASAGLLLPGAAGRIRYGEAKRILIIGAGIAGIAAARVLQDAGHEVIVLEGRERMGGRIWTDTSLDYPIDLGPSYIEQTRSNPLADFAAKTKLSIQKVDYNDYYLFDQEGQLLDDAHRESHAALTEKLLKKIQKALGKVEEEETFQNVVDAVLRNEKMDVAAWQTLQWRLAQLEIAAGIEFKHLAANDQYDLFFAEDDLMPVKGFEDLLQKMTTGIDIRYNQKVKIVRQSASNVTISTMGEDFDGDFCLVTLPLGVLKSTGIRFDPVFSTAKRNAVEKLEVGVINKLALQFETQFWPGDRAFIGHVGKRKGDFPIFTDLSKVSNKPYLVAAFGNDFSKTINKLSETEVMVHVHQLLYKMYENVPMPIGMKLTNWEADKFSRGATSYLPIGVDSVARDYLARPEKRFYFAGEATIREGAGTVLGAYNSGIRAAKWINER